MKKSTGSAEKNKEPMRVLSIPVKQTMIFFGLMAVLYLFSVFGGTFSSPEFTYAEF